ncbi:hypothetical protein ACSQ76_02410 [Roseovarius sp. B08]
MSTTMRRIDSAQSGNRIVTRGCALLRPGVLSHPDTGGILWHTLKRS